MLRLENIEARFGHHVIVDHLGFQLGEGEIGCLLGPSGCGKTTLLRTIAGFEAISSGHIELNQQTISTPQQQLPPEQRNVGMVFQDFALFPHLNVFDNIAFGIRKQSTQAQKARVRQLLEHVGLAAYEKRYPHQLSGGQQQRIALARALAPKPRLLLMDEPFSSLDAVLRESLANDMRQLIKDEGITALLVTHDQQEAFVMADRAGVMYQGKLLQWGTPYDLYHEPSHPFVANFIGQGVLLPGRVGSSSVVNTAIGELQCHCLSSQAVGDQVDVLIRPDDLIIDAQSPRRATIVAKGFRGAHFLYTVELADGSQLYCMTSSHQKHAIGEQIGLRLNMDHLVYFSADQCKL